MKSVRTDLETSIVPIPLGEPTISLVALENDAVDPTHDSHARDKDNSECSNNNVVSLMHSHYDKDQPNECVCYYYVYDKKRLLEDSSYQLACTDELYDLTGLL